MIETKYGETRMKGSLVELRADLACIAKAFKNCAGEEEARKAVELGLMAKEEERHALLAEKLGAELPGFLKDLVREILGPEQAPAQQPEPEPTPEQTPEPATEPAPEPEPEPPRFQRGDEVRFVYNGSPVVGVIIGTGVDKNDRYVLIDALNYPLIENIKGLEPTGRHFDLPLEKA